ncbi:helix-turn-helix domain-containing protein [Paenibacillus sp. S150]|uniref:helix-turn-helix domain-containing protein n=1 Tax=Paenibacillus sp. S150 TaxID=2749826 RepID=UPI001C573056|nr:helix-turn-helix transcriptional regulator [Paenibacillus sp. S150]MBW4084092.1 helix-turn-helix transcriptional regulator [Paenibacillus sp. S150]
MSRISEAVGSQIRVLRQERGISQEKLALIAGVNTSYVGQIERGIRSPTIDMLDKIAQALEVNVLELFRLETDRSPHKNSDTLNKLMFELRTRTEDEQNSVYDIVKRLLIFKDT